jgi:hypothetical protein
LVTEIKTTHILDFPKGTNPTDLKYEPTTSLLAFGAQVWDDATFEDVEGLDVKNENRGTTGMVFDELFIR